MLETGADFVLVITRRLRLARRLRVQQRWAELMNHHEEEKEDVAVVCKCSVLSTPS